MTSPPTPAPRPERRGTLRRIVVALLAALTGLTLVPSTASAADQVLTWTAGNSVVDYLIEPGTAVAGTATVVFDNSVAAGNTTGMPHTLTFDTSTPGYNHDVDLNIVANPFDANGGRYEVEVTLTPGTYRYFCAIPGHGQMWGELVVTGGDPDPDPDTTAPEVTATVTGEQDEDGSYLGSAQVTLAATDAGSGVDTLEYSLDDGAYTAYTTPITVDTPGEHTLAYRATDNAGNTAEDTLTLTVAEDAPDPDPDTTAPEVTATVTGDQDEDGHYLGSAQVTLAATDAGSGIDTLEYSLDDGEFTHYHAAITISEAGEHTLAYRATDNAGNTTEDTLTLTVAEDAPDPDPDTTAPEVTATVTGDQDEDGHYLGSAQITLAATDAGSGVDTLEYSLDGGEFTHYHAAIAISEAGEHTLAYRATDNAGNTTEDTLTLTVAEDAPDPDPDTTAPEVTATVTGDQDEDGSYLGSAQITLAATDAGSGVDTLEYSLDGGEFTHYHAAITISEPGEHTLAYRATDNAGNTTEDTLTLTVAEQAPGECPDSRDTVVIGGIDSGVTNVDLGDGCTINDLIDENGDYDSHGQFVRHVGDAVRPLADDELITQREAGMIIRAAARSAIGS
ncbi:OmpL47-type beta-barrel domain-containing protein [Georgenia faecalis]|uniref:OmpL47-type beta-barrel domain-containing protein n=1 Tax=Georgenia faecalis TaxID=2483799 RepID=A0ABV9DB42_9MICO|nr:plastocyanin/azurin family copper-binding protein [Georgenia faecalis]